MKKRICCFCMMLLFIFCLAGCSTHTYMTYTFSVSTGDSIDVKLETSDDYHITSDVPFEISQNGTVLTHGTFITAEDYRMYADAIGSAENTTILESGNTDTCEYLMWNYNDSEYNYAVLVNDSNTGLLLGNTVSEESAREVFDRLTISLH